MQRAGENRKTPEAEDPYTGQIAEEKKSQKTTFCGAEVKVSHFEKYTHGLWCIQCMCDMSGGISLTGNQQRKV